MSRTPTAIRSLLLSTVLTAPFVMTAHAQGIQINEEALVGKSDACRELAELVQSREEPISAVQTQEVVNAINEDMSEICMTIGEEIVSATQSGETGSETERLTEEETASETERLTEEVELSEEATIEGEAVVSVPEPNVDVEVPAPDVRVTEQHPQIDITQDPAQIELTQAQPQIAVEIPEIIVRVEIPAPQLYVLRQDPQVRVTSADPQVEVTQGEPRVSVRQADPNLNIDLGVEPGEASAEGTSVADSGQQDQGQEQVGGDVSVAGTEPRVEIVQAEGQPQMTYETGEPALSYESAEPQISVMMAEQPQIEVQQSGQATVILETPEEREQRRQQQQQANAGQQGSGQQDSGQQESGQQVAQSDQPEAGSASQTGTGTVMTVGEIMDMEVVTADGEELGNPEALIDVNGETNLVLEDGGFLGLGANSVPVQLSRVTIQDGQIVLENMTEDEIEAANNFRYDENIRLPEDQRIQVGG